jgi:hypothetical protein
VRSCRWRMVTSSRSAGCSATVRMIWNAMLACSRLAIVPEAGAVLHEHAASSHARSQDTQPRRRLRAHDEIASESGSCSTTEDCRAELARRDIDKQTSTMLCLTWTIAVLTLANVAFVRVLGLAALVDDAERPQRHRARPV